MGLIFIVEMDREMLGLSLEQDAGLVVVWADDYKFFFMNFLQLKLIIKSDIWIWYLTNQEHQILMNSDATFF